MTAGRVLGLLTLGVLGLLGASLMAGSYPLGPGAALATLLGAAPSETAETVVQAFRLPRALTAFGAGAAMALSGTILQVLTRNPLADPSLIGVSQGAALAVVSVTVLAPDLSAALRPLIAIAGALAVAAVILWISADRRSGASMRFILTGIGVAGFLSALTSALLTYGQLDRAVSALAWLAGSIHAAGWAQVAMVGGGLAVGAPLAAAGARSLGALRFGPELAVGLGVPVRRVRAGLVGLAVLLAAVAVAAAGPLGFVGLVAPHLAARLARAGIGGHMALSAATGALMVGAADLLGRIGFGAVQIPAGLLTAVIGAPVFVYLVLRPRAGIR